MPAKVRRQFVTLIPPVVAMIGLAGGIRLQGRGDPPVWALQLSAGFFQVIPSEMSAVRRVIAWLLAEQQGQHRTLILGALLRRPASICAIASKYPVAMGCLIGVEDTKRSILGRTSV